MNVLLCPLSDPGYLYPSIAVGREVQRRGDNVYVLGPTSAAPVLAEADLPLVPAEPYLGKGSLSVARWAWEARVRYPAILQAAREIRADVLVTSVLCHEALLVAETLDLPVIVIGLAAHLSAYREGGLREPVNPAQRAWRTSELLRYYERAREQVGLPARSFGETDYPIIGTALLLRGDPALEYPGAVLPDRVHHVGPCLWEPSAPPAEVEEISDRLDRIGKPIIYIHLGRIFQGTSPWPRLNAAFTNGPFQAVVELGRSDEEDLRPAPGTDLTAVRKPWMAPLIDRAGVVLTSGTSAPVLNALVRGRPLGVTPHGSEQPPLAEACVRAGVATYIPAEPDPESAYVLSSLWHDSALRARAGEFRQRLAAAPGVELAADIIQHTTAEQPAVASTA